MDNAGDELINHLVSYPQYKKQWMHYKKEFLREAVARKFLKIKIMIFFLFQKCMEWLRELRINFGREKSLKNVILGFKICSVHNTLPF